MKPILDVEGLSKRYFIASQLGYQNIRESVTSYMRGIINPGGPLGEEFWALKDISFKVEAGERLGIIGRNGAGKSTLLKLLSRITEPSRGRITLRGRVASLLEVGTGFHAELSGRENIFLNGAVLGMRRREILEKFDDIVAFSEVGRFLETPVKRYSSGMYMRLAFAVAAHLEPEILIVDEVLAVGDAAFQKKCLGKMKEAGGQGRTVLFVSHQMNAIEQLCGRCLFLEKGGLRVDSADVGAAIRSYLFEGGLHEAGAVWKSDAAHFKPGFKPLAFGLETRLGQILHGPARADQDLWVRAEFEVPSADPALRVGYTLFAEGGEMLYSSFHNDEPDGLRPALEAGINTLRCRLPQHLLNEGRYRLELSAGLRQKEWYLEPGRSVVSFDFSIQGGLSQSETWLARRPGLLAPLLHWERL